MHITVIHGNEKDTSHPDALKEVKLESIPHSLAFRNPMQLNIEKFDKEQIFPGGTLAEID